MAKHGGLFGRRGLSSIVLVAAIVLVAILITYLMGYISELFMRYEQIEILDVNAVWNASQRYWEITLKIKNTGSAAATIDDILFNGVSISNVKSGGYYANYKSLDQKPTSADFGNATIPVSVNIVLGSGQERYLAITLPNGAIMENNSIATSGLNLEIKIHTASGKEYPKLIVLP